MNLHCPIYNNLIYFLPIVSRDQVIKTKPVPLQLVTVSFEFKLDQALVKQMGPRPYVVSPVKILIGAACIE